MLWRGSLSEGDLAGFNWVGRRVVKFEFRRKEDQCGEEKVRNSMGTLAKLFEAPSL